MKKNITPIIATYKRPILLERCLYFLNKNFLNLTTKKYILYHFDRNFHSEYLKIFKDKSLVIKKRAKKNFFSKKNFRIRTALNCIYYLIRWYQIITNFNSFKEDLENILKEIKTEFVMIIPDDLIMFKKTTVSKKILDIFMRNPMNYYYKFTSDYKNIEKSIKKEDVFVKKFLSKNKKKSFFLWKNNFKSKNINLNYNFHFEAIYHRKSLLTFIRSFYYNNPTTLESIGFKLARGKIFNFGISPMIKTAETYQINTVQNLIKQKHRLNIDPVKLNDYFKKGFKLNIGKKFFANGNTKQNRVQLKKNKKLIFI